MRLKLAIYLHLVTSKGLRQVIHQNNNHSQNPLLMQKVMWKNIWSYLGGTQIEIGRHFQCMHFQ